MAQNYLQAIEGETFNAATLTGTPQPINPNGLPEACNILRITNASTVAVAISYDGVTDNDAVLSNQVLTLNAQTNALPNGNVALFRKGTIVYVYGTAAGVGEIILAGYYQGAS